MYSHRRRVLRAPSRAPGPEEPRRTPWPRCTDSHLLMIGGKLPKPSTQFEFSLRWWNRGGELSCRDRSGFRPDVGTDRPAKPRKKTFRGPPDWASGHQSEECLTHREQQIHNGSHYQILPPHSSSTTTVITLMYRSLESEEQVFVVVVAAVGSDLVRAPYFRNWTQTHHTSKQEEEALGWKETYCVQSGGKRMMSTIPSLSRVPEQKLLMSRM